MAAKSLSRALILRPVKRSAPPASSTSNWLAGRTMASVRAQSPHTAQRLGAGSRQAASHAEVRSATPAQAGLSLATVCQAQLYEGIRARIRMRAVANRVPTESLTALNRIVRLAA